MSSTLKIKGGMYTLTAHTCPSCRRESALELTERPFYRGTGPGTIERPVVHCTVCGYIIRAEDSANATFTKS